VSGQLAARCLIAEYHCAMCAQVGAGLRAALASRENGSPGGQLAWGQPPRRQQAGADGHAAQSRRHGLQASARTAQQTVHRPSPGVRV
jgi:hypothetical protein